MAAAKWPDQIKTLRNHLGMKPRPISQTNDAGRATKGPLDGSRSRIGCRHAGDGISRVEPSLRCSFGKKKTLLREVGCKEEEEESHIKSAVSDADADLFWSTVCAEKCPVEAMEVDARDQRWSRCVSMVCHSGRM